MGRLRELVEQFWTYELDLLASDAAALAAQRHGPPLHHTNISDTSPQDKGPLS
jgi:hypothetical protein